MRKRAKKLEWIVVESDAEWEHLSVATPADTTLMHSPHLPWRHLWHGALLCLALLSLGGWGWQRKPTLPFQPIAEAAGRLPSEQATHGQSADTLITRVIRAVRATVQATKPTVQVDVTFSLVRFQQQHAIFNVVATLERGATAYRQTLFYQRTPTGWWRVAPNATLWGAQQSLETSNFVFHFHQHDRQTVTTVAPQIDALYTTMRRNFGLPISLDGEKLIIDVSLTTSPGTLLPPPSKTGHLTIASPVLYLAPAELTDEQILAQAMALPLLDHLLAQASEHHGLQPAWQPLLGGLRLWQLWDLDLPLAVWQDEVVQWLYVDLPTPAAGQKIVLPAHYPALCRAHQLWITAPQQIRIPLWCHGLEQGEFYTSWRQHRTPPSSLVQLLPILPHAYARPPDVTAHITYPGQAVALATIIEYAVTTYGRERLPTLVAGLGQYRSWKELIPAVYGVSSAEFEAGWQAYLAVQYGTAPIDK